jgi:hypothetical protein
VGPVENSIDASERHLPNTVGNAKGQISERNNVQRARDSGLTTPGQWHYCENVEITLLDNARSFLAHGIGHLSLGKDAENLKWAVISLAQACELTLLEKIAQGDEAAIFRDGIHTISWREALIQTRQVSKPNVNNHLLVPLFQLRHLLIHHQVEEDSFDVEIYLGRAIHWLGMFLENELNEDLFEWAGSEEAYRTLMDLEEARPLVKRAIEGTAGGITYASKGTEFPLIHCSSCYEESLVVSHELPLYGTCTSCGHQTTFATCERCSGTFPTDDWGSDYDPNENWFMCSTCKDYIDAD